MVPVSSYEADSTAVIDTDAAADDDEEDEEEGGSEITVAPLYLR